MNKDDIPKKFVIDAAYNLYIKLRLEQDKTEQLELEIKYQRTLSVLVFLLGVLVPSTAIILLYPFAILLTGYLIIFMLVVATGYKANRKRNQLVELANKHAEKWQQIHKQEISNLN
jgi:hypothetical protein